MKTRFLLLCALFISLIACAPAASVQTPTPAPAYTGPRFPGGPDSLRAFVYRATQQAGTAPAGRAVVRFELAKDGQPQNFKLLTPPTPASPELTGAAAKALSYLKERMPAWQLGTPDPKADPNQNQTVSLPLDFTTTVAAQPYDYADQNPVFAELVPRLQARHNRFYDRLLNDPVQRAIFQSSTAGLVAYTQMQVMYPPAALRQHQQGQVLAYFEVTETGAIEHLEIVGTAGDALDTEVLRAIRQLPAATTPALLQGGPVRIFYVLPITFKIQ